MDQVLVERLRELTPSLDREIGAERGKPHPGSRFSDLMSGLLSEVNDKQNQAESNAAGLAKGEVGLMETVVSLNEADLSLRMMLQIRDRALDAYQSILRSI